MWEQESKSDAIEDDMRAERKPEEEERRVGGTSSSSVEFTFTRLRILEQPL